MKIHHAMFVLGSIFCTHANAAQPTRIPVTDPAVLADLGLPAGTSNVWRLVAPDAGPAAAKRNLAGDVPSIDGRSYSVTGDDFSMVSTTAAYLTSGNSYLFCPVGSGGNNAAAVVHVPDGHQLEYLDFWGGDDSTTENMTAYLIETCMADDSDTTGYQTILAQISSSPNPSGAPGDFFRDALIPTYYADPRSCTYTVNVVLSTGTCQGEDLIAYKVRVTWADAN